MLCLLGTFKGSHWSKPFQCTGKDESIVGNEICFSKIASMHCTDCNSIINRFHHKFFLKNVLKKKHVLDSIRELSDHGKFWKFFCQISLPFLF